ncbi:MAG: radical SAM (seleno)protein TrsS [Halodesulfovibrio sp.]
MVKRCPEHGTFRTPVWRGEPSITSWRKPKLPTPPAPQNAPSQGCPYDCGLCAQHRQHTCTVLLEVTARCNLTCTYCFASAGTGSAVDDPGLPQLKEQLRKARAAAGSCNVQLSGGEPTMRSDLPAIISAAKELFPFVQLNTNGLRIARESGYANALAEAGLDSVFLQFDGTTNDIYRALRGAPLLADKLRVIHRLGEAGIGVVLVPTVVPGVNADNVGALLRVAAAFSPVVRGVHFQPVSHFGRFPDSGQPNWQNGPLPQARITLPEIMRGLEEQTGGLVAAADFLPPGCEHALCSFHANYLVHENGRLQRLSVQRKACSCEAAPASEGADAAKAFVKRQWAAPAAGSTRKGENLQIPEALHVAAFQQGKDCDPEAFLARLCAPDASAGSGAGSGAAGTAGQGTNDLDAFVLRAATHVLAISAMAFQDAWNLDLERLQGCCIHVSAPDGRLVPFCSWNCTAADGTPLHRRAS